MSSDDLLERAKQEGTPLIDGEDVTFVWEGERAPYLIGDFNEWDNPEKPKLPMREHVPGVWTLTMQFTPGAYLEYSYIDDMGDPESRLADPFNKRRISNGMGKYNNFFDMPEAKHTRLIRRKRGITAGEITQHTLDASHFVIFGKERKLWLYHPPVTEKVPLLVVYDGRDYLRRARLPQIVDNLIAQGRIRPIALAMVAHAGKARFLEYFSNDGMLNMLTMGVLPVAYNHLNLISFNDHPGAHGVLGASMGGLQALYTGLRLPGIFGKVISQSGAFDFDPTSNTEAIIKVLVRSAPKRDLQIWQDVGRYEWLLASNREMRDLLRECGYNPTYQEFDAGHNYTGWRDMLPEALETLFGS